jgi:ribosome-associated toxin RatA of RatAB toxin-antitoxin module
MTVVVRKNSEVPFSCAQMYALVNDVENYATFLPNCEESIVHHRDEDEVQATIVLAAMGFNKSFTTKNRLQANKMIEIRLVDGPFSHLEGFWRFDPTENGCLISFDLEFEFASRMVGMMLGPIFEEITKKVFDAFRVRAQEVYGDQRIISV